MASSLIRARLLRETEPSQRSRIPNGWHTFLEKRGTVSSIFPRNVCHSFGMQLLWDDSVLCSNLLLVRELAIKLSLLRTFFETSPWVWFRESRRTAFAREEIFLDFFYLQKALNALFWVVTILQSTDISQEDEEKVNIDIFIICFVINFSVKGISSCC